MYQTRRLLAMTLLTATTLTVPLIDATSDLTGQPDHWHGHDGGETPSCNYYNAALVDIRAILNLNLKHTLASSCRRGSYGGYDCYKCCGDPIGGILDLVIGMHLWSTDAQRWFGLVWVEECLGLWIHDWDAFLQRNISLQTIFNRTAMTVWYGRNRLYIFHIDIF